MKTEPLGEQALRFALPPDLDRAGTLAALRALPGVEDVVFTEVWGAIRFVGEPPDVGSAIRCGVSAPAGRTHLVKVRYDGPDLDRVAAWSGLAVDEVIRRHAAPTYTVRFLGFLPGFAYLGEVDPSIAAPRLGAPRPRVPAGAVAVAGGRTGIYPSVSPGGWNLVGTAVDFHVFDVVSGAILAPGDSVRFEPA